jgi:hypothetical protein
MRLLNSLAALFIIAAFGLKAQECKVYIPSTVGTEIELTTYDKKDKPTGIIKQTLKEINQSGDTTIYIIHQVTTDEKGKDPMEGTYKFKCLGEVFYIDMNTFMDQKTMDAYKDMQMKMTTENIMIPSKMSAGEKLKDGFIKMEVVAGPIPITLSVDVTNRLVERFEDVTTSAGTFSCVKISQDNLGNFGFIKTNFHTVTWYSEKIGTVRSETYNKGKLENYMVLTSIKK